jgi:cell division protease FtsH
MLRSEPSRMDSRQEKPQKAPGQASRSGLVWFLVWIGLMIWNLVALWPRGHPEARIPYTTFLAQVRAGNVAHVRIVAEEIGGSLVKPIPWPPPEVVGKGRAAEPGQPTPPGNGATPEEAKRPATPGAPTETYGRFVTTFPAVVGDSSLLPLLEKHAVVVEAAPGPSPWLTALLTNALPLVLLVLFFLWMGGRAAKSQAGIFGFGRSKARRYTADRPQVTFGDVAGADEAKTDLQGVVDFLRHPRKYHDLGARIPRGVLLVGPPGTGKTLLARAVAGEAAVPFFSLSASEFVEMFVGVGASRVRDLFEQTKAAAPAILFIDELDAVGRRRGAGVGAVNDEREQTLNQLLVEMDGFDERQEVIVLSATNRPDVLDPALLRPGRFDRRVEVGLPDRPGRAAILRIHTRRLPLGDDVDLTRLAGGTPGFSGADLANLCNEAALIAAQANRGQVTAVDFEEAMDKVLLGGKRSLLLDPRDRRVIAFHEAGHALVAWRTPAADPVQKVTIIPRGQALGVTEQMPEEERYNHNRTYLLARLTVMLGGRTAEEIVFGDLTTGAENDLVEATRLARRMVTRWGMGSLGPVAFQADEQQPFLGYNLSQGREYGEAMADRIDEDVTRLLDERHQAATRLLKDAREPLDCLARELLEHETVDHEALTRILGSRPAIAEAPVLRPPAPQVFSSNSTAPSQT